jgi:hypothetical protein
LSGMQDEADIGFVSSFNGAPGRRLAGTPC